MQHRSSHGISHVDGDDDIQDATAAQKGLATAAQITKLDGITSLIDKDINDPSVLDVYEHFNLDPEMLSAAENDKTRWSTYSEKSTPTKIILLEGGGQNSYWASSKRLWNPAIHGYLECGFKVQFNTIPTTIWYGLFDYDWAYMAYITNGTASGINFVTTTDSGGENTETTENIAVTLTDENEFLIKIKDGEAQLWINDGTGWALAATHSTAAAIPYDAPPGMQLQLYADCGNLEYCFIDYYYAKNGKVF